MTSLDPHTEIALACHTDRRRALDIDRILAGEGISSRLKMGLYLPGASVFPRTLRPHGRR